jgi:hypothetical protein
VQFTGNEIKQRLMARGTLLKRQQASPAPPPVSATPPAEPGPPPSAFPDTVPPEPAPSFRPPVALAATTTPFSPFPYDDATPDEAPPVSAGAPGNPPPPAPPRLGLSWNRAMIVGPIATLLVGVALFLLVMHQTHNRGRAPRNAAAVQINITTTPPGAAVRVAAGGIRLDASAAAGVGSAADRSGTGQGGG